jgi:WD domain, G-beta repeat
MYTLKGHSQAVWAVLVVDSTQYLTGTMLSLFSIWLSPVTLKASADKTIMLWHGHKPVRTYSGHTDAVRGLAFVPDIGFASCANDRWMLRAFHLSVMLTLSFEVRSEFGRRKVTLCIHCPATRRLFTRYRFSPLARLFPRERTVRFAFGAVCPWYHVCST